MGPELITLALIAGGESRRMGTDKALLIWRGVPLARRAVLTICQALAERCAEVLIAGGSTERGIRLGALCLPDHAMPWRAIADEERGGGPLAGILSALHASRTDWVMVSACDRPSVAPDLVRHLVALALAAPLGTEVVLPASKRGLEPLLALYHRCALPRLRAEFAKGQRAVVDFLHGGRILVSPPEVVTKLDPEQRSFANFNTPQDLSVFSMAAPATAVPTAGDVISSPMEREREEILRLVAGPLGAVPQRMRAALASPQAPVQAMLEHLARYEGKLLRPGLVLLAAGAVRANPLLDNAESWPAALTEVASIVEMVHVATLVHDDVLDEATVRRRVESVNLRFGNHVAVLLGDYIYARAFHLATQLASPVCAQVLSDVTRELCEGQIAELAACRDFRLGEAGYLQIAQGKTASLYGAACRLGATYGGGDSAAAKALEGYGRDLGLGFQIVDDCLDLSGREEVVGKSLGTDLSEGKITLPMLIAHERADDAGRRRIEAMFASPHADSAQLLAELRSELDLGSAVEEALRRADHYLRRAASALNVLPESPFRASLTRVPEYILCREW